MINSIQKVNQEAWYKEGVKLIKLEATSSIKVLKIIILKKQLIK